MSVIQPLTKDKAAPELGGIFDKLTHVFGHMPNIFGAMARCPAALEHFLPLYSAVIDRGSLEPKYKELAYLKTSRANGCEY
jgi:alkylhydroperoxidase family enzyme